MELHGPPNGESALAGALRDLERERVRAEHAYRAVVRSLAAALEARDGYTGEHSDDVHVLSVAVARRLGLDHHTIAEIEAVALLHDIGKIGIPDHILHKPGPLDEHEWQLMREHPVIGERILRPLPGLANVATAVRHEHERWDGNGYPDGKRGDTIPLASRIVLACDTYSALVSDRPYRKALGRDAAIGELRRNAGTQFDPEVVDALLACLADPSTFEAPADDDRARAIPDAAGEVEQRRLERELHALIAIATSVASAHRLEDVVEIAADCACQAIDAASLSISRWDEDRRSLRTLINAGELGPGEERLPADETYELEQDSVLRHLLEEGRPHVASVDDPDIVPLERDLLVGLGKHHSVAVPIAFNGRPWGELWATRRGGQPRFGERDVRFLQTISGQIAAAVGRAEVFSRMAELAFKDPLTGIANRRALDERLERALADAGQEGTGVAVLLCDLDELKELNDAEGHEAGDAALKRVAEVLADVTAQHAGSMVARVGGDEFCVVLEDAGVDEARELGERLIARLRTGEGRRLSASCGVSASGPGIQRAGDLLRLADGAQYTAKRSGRARVCVADAHAEAGLLAGSTERRAIRGREPHAHMHADVPVLLRDVLAALDGKLCDRPPLDRAEAVAMAVGEAVDASATSVTWVEPGGGRLETVFLHDRRFARTSGHRFNAEEGGIFPLDDYPESRRVIEQSSSFLVDAGDAGADPAERAFLVERGMSAVVAAGACNPATGGWLVEVYADAASGPLGEVEPTLRLLTAEAIRGAKAVPLRAAS